MNFRDYGNCTNESPCSTIDVHKCYSLSVRAIDIIFIPCARMSKGVIHCTLVLLNVHAYIKRAIERLLHLNEV